MSSPRIDGNRVHCITPGPLKPTHPFHPNHPLHPEHPMKPTKPSRGHHMHLPDGFEPTKPRNPITILPVMTNPETPTR